MNSIVVYRLRPTLLPTSGVMICRRVTGRMQVCLRTSAFLTLAIALCASCIFASEVTKQRFLSEAPDAWQKLQKSTNQLDLAGISTSSLLEDGKVVKTLRRRFEVLKDEDNVLMRQRDISPEGEESGLRIRVLNSRYGFVLESHGVDNWRVLNAGASNSVRAKIEHVISITGLEFAHAPWRIAEKSLPTMFMEPGFEVIDASVIGQPDSDTVQVHFDYVPAEDDSSPLRGGTVELLPDKLWAIRTYSVSLNYEDGQVGKVEAHVEYGDADYPTPSKYTMTVSTTGDSGKTTVKEFPYLRYDRRSVPLEMFTLQSYGLPESIALVNEAPAIGYWSSWGLALVGVTCVVAALILAVAARRRRTGCSLRHQI